MEVGDPSDHEADLNAVEVDRSVLRLPLLFFEPPWVATTPRIINQVKATRSMLWIEVEVLYSSIGASNDLLELGDEILIDPLGVKHIHLIKDVLDVDVIIHKHGFPEGIQLCLQFIGGLRGWIRDVKPGLLNADERGLSLGDSCLHLLNRLALKRQVLQHSIYLLCLRRILRDKILLTVLLLHVERNWGLRWGTLQGVKLLTW